MELFFGILFVLLLALAIWGFFDGQASKESIQQEIAGLKNFTLAHVWYASDWGRAMALDSTRRQLALVQREQGQLQTRIIDASSLSDLKEIGCKSAWPVHISSLSWAIERLLPCKIVKICPRPAEFSLRFFKPDRLLAASSRRKSSKTAPRW